MQTVRKLGRGWPAEKLTSGARGGGGSAVSGDEHGAALALSGKRDEARELLASVCDWFTEGFNTVDLEQAKTLLDELNGR